MTQRSVIVKPDELLLYTLLPKTGFWDRVLIQRRKASRPELFSDRWKRKWKSSRPDGLPVIKTHSVGKIFHSQEEVVVAIVWVCKKHLFNLLLSRLASTCFLIFMYRTCTGGLQKKACRELNGKVLSLTLVEEENLACSDGLWPGGAVWERWCMSMSSSVHMLLRYNHPEALAWHRWSDLDEMVILAKKNNNNTCMSSTAYELMMLEEGSKLARSRINTVWGCKHEAHGRIDSS